MQDTKFNVGDKVRYIGSKDCTSEWIGLEGTISDVDDIYVTVTITKGNSSSNRGVGSEIFPDITNLELVQPVQQPIILEEPLHSPNNVEHPAHYGGDTTYEVIKVAEAWGLDKDAYLFNVIKYVGRAGKKAKSTLVEDLKKARFYLDRRIKALEEELSTVTSS